MVLLRAVGLTNHREQGASAFVCALRGTLQCLMSGPLSEVLCRVTVFLESPTPELDMWQYCHWPGFQSVDDLLKLRASGRKPQRSELPWGALGQLVWRRVSLREDCPAESPHGLTPTPSKWVVSLFLLQDVQNQLRESAQCVGDEFMNCKLAMQAKVFF